MSRAGKGTPWCIKCRQPKEKGRYGKTYCLPCAAKMGRNAATSTSDSQAFRQRDQGPSTTRSARIYRGGPR